MGDETTSVYRVYGHVGADGCVRRSAQLRVVVSTVKPDAAGEI